MIQIKKKNYPTKFINLILVTSFLGLLLVLSAYSETIQEKVQSPKSLIVNSRFLDGIELTSEPSYELTNFVSEQNKPDNIFLLDGAYFSQSNYINSDEILLTAVPPIPCGDANDLTCSGICATGEVCKVYNNACICQKTCGNGIVESPEQCDGQTGNCPANANPCKTVSCNDCNCIYLDAPDGTSCGPNGEVCSAGNCNGSSTSGSTSSSTSGGVCGDGIKDDNEECEYSLCGPDCCPDNGTCKITNGCVFRKPTVSDADYNPDMPNGFCGTLCGDGIKISPEECDDGNNINGDGCSSVCKNDNGSSSGGSSSSSSSGGSSSSSSSSGEPPPQVKINSTNCCSYVKGGPLDGHCTSPRPCHSGTDTNICVTEQDPVEETFSCRCNGEFIENGCLAYKNNSPGGGSAGACADFSIRCQLPTDKGAPSGVCYTDPNPGSEGYTCECIPEPVCNETPGEETDELIQPYIECLPNNLPSLRNQCRYNPAENVFSKCEGCKCIEIPDDCQEKNLAENSNCTRGDGTPGKCRKNINDVIFCGQAVDL